MFSGYRFHVPGKSLAAGLFLGVLAFGLAWYGSLQTWLFENHEGTLTFRIETSADGVAQVYFDRGNGFNETDSVRAELRAGRGLQAVSMALPKGRYRSFRFDPLNGPGTLRVTDLALRDGSGKTLAVLRVGEMSKNDQVASVTARDGLSEIQVASSANDPWLYFAFRPGAEVLLEPRPWDPLVGATGRFVTLFAAAWASLGLAAWVLANRCAVKSFALRRPVLAIVLAAFASSLLAEYPVVLLGRSLVSPNIGTSLFRSRVPLVPGADEPVVSNTHGSDTGAMMWQHVPYSVIQGRALDGGELPLWNRYNSSGTTLLGQGQSMFGDPFHQVLVWLGAPSWAWDVKLGMARVWFGAGLGLLCWWMYRRLGPALVVAVAAPFSGFFIFRIAHPSVTTLGYGPWILAGWVWFIVAETRRDLVVAIAMTLASHWILLTSGTVKEAYLTVAFLDVAGFLAWLLHPSKRIDRRVGFALLASTGLAVLLTTAPHWGNFLDALTKSRTAYEHHSIGQLPPRQFLSLFDDLFDRYSKAGYRVVAASGNLVMLLGFAAAFGAVRYARGSRWFRAIAAVALLLLAMAYGFVPAKWILAFPFLRNVEQAGAVYAIIVLPLVWLCAGWGFVCVEKAAKEGRRGELLLGGLLVVGGIVWAFEPYLHDPKPSFFASNMALFLSFGGLGLLCFLLGGRLKVARWAAWVVWPAFALTAFHRHGLQEVSWGGRDWFGMPMSRADLYVTPKAVAWVKAGSAEPFRVTGLGNHMMAGFSGVYGLEGINGPDALMNRHYRRYCLAEELTGPETWYFEFHPDNLGRFARVLDLLGVRYVFCEEAVLPADSGTVWRFDGELQVHERPGAWPRAFFTDTMAVYPKTEDFVRLVHEGDGRPFAAIDAEGAAALRVMPQGELARRHVKSAADYHLTTNTTSFTVEASAPGYAVLMETYSDGDFTATVDGREMPCLRVNEFAKGVHLETAGVHRVSFSYRPRYLTLTLWTMAGGLLLSGAILWSVRRIAVIGPGGRADSSEAET